MEQKQTPKAESHQSLGVMLVSLPTASPLMFDHHANVLLEDTQLHSSRCSREQWDHWREKGKVLLPVSNETDDNRVQSLKVSFFPETFASAPGHVSSFATRPQKFLQRQVPSPYQTRKCHRRCRALPQTVNTSTIKRRMLPVIPALTSGLTSFSSRMDSSDHG